MDQMRAVQSGGSGNGHGEAFRSKGESAWLVVVSTDLVLTSLVQRTVVGCVKCCFFLKKKKNYYFFYFASGNNYNNYFLFLPRYSVLRTTKKYFAQLDTLSGGVLVFGLQGV